MQHRAFTRSACALSLSLLGCGADNEKSSSTAANPAQGEDGDTATQVEPQTSTVQTPPPVDDSAPIELPSGTGEGPSPSKECQRDIYEAKRVELNLLLLVDLSGSMLQMVNVETRETQWDAVRGAVRTFVDSAEADGLGMSLTYYPVLGERTACQEDSTCSDGTPCIVAVCGISTYFGYPYPCASDRDCPFQAELEDGTIVDDECVLPYSCSDHPLQFCVADESCPNDDTCNEDAGPIGACPGGVSCAIDDYSTPAVPLAVLPEGREALLSSLDASYVDFYSNTPTQVALQGAFQQVGSWQESAPDKRSVVVLATDGIPQGCETILQQDAPLATLNVLREGTDQDISTFVIGVLPQADDSVDGLAEVIAAQTASLEEMATAGGTVSPFIVQAGTSTTQAFLEALDKIRTVALPCDYELPEDTTDFDMVNVEITTGGKTETLPKVDNLVACAEGGWYYDSDETPEDDTPTRAVLCPDSCDEAKQAGDGRLDVVLGCPTVQQIR